MVNFAEDLKFSRLALAIGCVFAASSTAALAQDTGDDEADNAEEPVEKIQVLGSRIRSDGLDQAAPSKSLTRVKQLIKVL